jgi:D-alanyl-D-alanine dipeptidase
MKPFAFYLPILYSCILLSSCKPGYLQPAGALTAVVNCITIREGACETELRMMADGLVDVAKLNNNILVEMKYAGSDNFMGYNVYGSFNKAYLQPDVALMLVRAQQCLDSLAPGLHILVYDAARPRCFQKVIWDSLKMPASEKGKYACSPRNGSLHNYGAAVDVTLADSNAKALDMGCAFDHFGILAYPYMEHVLLANGQLNSQQVENRKLLRKIMSAAGFFNIQTEWWHFNACTRLQAQAKYKIIE